jgi:hypothetical protein
MFMTEPVTTQAESSAASDVVALEGAVLTCRGGMHLLRLPGRTAAGQ